MSDTTQKFIVIRGLSKKVFFNLDIGKKRSFSDVLSIGKERKYTTSLAAAIRLCHSYDMKTIESTKYEFNFAILNEYFEKNKGIEDSLRFVVACDTESKLLSPSFTAAAHYIFHRISSEDANRFMEKLITGENLDKNSPIYLLREKLIEMRFRRFRAPNRILFIMFFKSWNYYRNNENPKYIKVNRKSKFILPI